jgi:predicted GIY-YIG superfamily endonuclease
VVRAGKGRAHDEGGGIVTNPVGFQIAITEPDGETREFWHSTQDPRLGDVIVWRRNAGAMLTPTGTTVVYRVFDVGGNLLYIGISRDLVTRIKGHRHARWYADAVRWERSSGYPSRELAHAAEVAAIRDEHPRWNDKHQVKPERKGVQLTLKLDPDVALVLHRAKYATCRTKKDLVQAAILQVYGEGQQAT